MEAKGNQGQSVVDKALNQKSKFRKKEKAIPKFKKCRCCKLKGNKPGTCSDCRGSGEIRIVHSRNKGNNYERQVAQQLSTWMGSTITRTPMSGGYNKHGDLTPKDPAEMIRFPFCLELKNREAWDMSELIKGTNESGIMSWWIQCVNDSRQCDKIPALIFTKKLDINYGMMTAADFDQVFSSHKDQDYPIAKFHHTFTNPDVMKHLDHASVVVIFPFDELLKLSYERVLESIKE